jgi:hypothetical protein
MTPEKKQQLSMTMKKIAALSEEKRIEIASKLGIMTIEGRLISGINQMMVVFQYEPATVIGGFQQWKRAGRCVKKGEHAIYIWVPLGNKDAQGNISEASRFIFAPVFDVSQTDVIETEETQISEVIQTTNV